jgi:hypothetical protein
MAKTGTSPKTVVSVTITVDLNTGVEEALIASKMILNAV